MENGRKRKTKITLDRIPYQFCEGPFWGNGNMGAVLYVKDGKLCISVDHVGLWELRETLPDEPRATFSEILGKRQEYLEGSPELVAPTDIFEGAIGRTRLPSLAVELGFPGQISGFESVTDLETAETDVKLELDGKRVIRGRIRLDSCVNVLLIDFYQEEELEVRALGWDLESPKLKPLKNWGYPPCEQREEEDRFFISQQFGGDHAAVLCGKKERKAENGQEVCCMAVSIAVGKEAEKEEMRREGCRLTEEYLNDSERFYAAHCEDWKVFWSGFDLKIPNARLQEAFELEMYKLYCNEREDSMPITLQGIWNPDNRMPAWFGDLHNDLNVQSCYWPAYKTGNVCLVRPYVEYYCGAMERLEERTRKLFGVEDAISLPTMMAPDGTGAASEWCYWNTLLGPELFAAVDFVWFYEYSRELDTLRDKIYPFLEKVVHLYQGIAYRGEDGLWHIPFTESPEVDRDGRMLMLDDSTFTLSCLHYLCRKLMGYAVLLGKDGSIYEKWEKELVSVVPNETGYPLFPGVNVFHSHRHFCQMYPIFPLCQEAHNEAANASLDTAINQGFLEYAAFSFPYMGIFAARCGRGNMCRTMLEIYCMVFRSRNSFTVNGDPYQNGVLRISDTNAGESSDAFTLESGFFVPTLLCEMFVHRAENDIWLLMGIPDEWRDCSCAGFTVEGDHRFDIEMEQYEVNRIRLHAGCDEKINMHWKGRQKIKRLTRNGEAVPDAVRKSVEADGVGENSVSFCLILHRGDEWELEF